MTKRITLSNYIDVVDPDFYWMSQLAKLPSDIRRFIKVISGNDKEKMIEHTHKLYNLMERDYSHDESFKPYYAFAKIALSYTRRR